MLKMQDKVLNELNSIAGSYELEAIISYNASNTGNVYFMDGFESILLMEFNFQSSHCSMIFYNAQGKSKLPLEQSSQYLEYHTKELKAVIDFISDYLMEYDMEKHEEG